MPDSAMKLDELFVNGENLKAFLLKIGLNEEIAKRETFFAQMLMAVKSQNELAAIAIYEQMSPEVLERFYRECLPQDERFWLEALIKAWERYKERHG